VDLVVVGHVTRDEIMSRSGDDVRLGGAAAYAALAAARLGYETLLITVAPPEDPLLEPLHAAPRLTVHCVPSDVMTTFALDYTGRERVLTLRRRARALDAADLPPTCLRAPVAYIGPVAGECDAALVRALDARFVGAGLQGWLRRASARDGRVKPADLAEAPRLDVAVVSEDDHPRVKEIALRLVAEGATVAVTHGARGAMLATPSGWLINIPAAPAREVDPTGAGDVFGVVLTLQLAAGVPPEPAARAAAEAAARVVEGPGLGTLPLPN
jgi:sugar/nucleoside kinase (ribokinase family)